MRKLALILLLAATPAFGANWYVHKGASGSNNGTNWTNAWNELNQINYGSVACGDTIFVAGGSYTTELTTSKTCTLGNVLLIERVLATDAAAVASPGWSAGFDSTVNCVGECIDAEGAFITVSGRLGSGGASSGYGWVITTPVGGGNTTRGALAGNLTSFTYYGIAGVGPACAPAGNCTTAAYGFNIAPSVNIVNGLTIDHCLAYNMSETVRESNWENATVQYSSFHDQFNDGIDHEDVVYNYTFAVSGNVVWRYNTIYNSPNDGVFFEFGGANNFYFYRNVYWNSGNSLMTTKTPGTYGPMFIYNNTFGSNTGPCSSTCAFITDNGSTMTGVVVKNNVFLYVTNSMQGSAGETSSNNAYSYTTLGGFSWPSGESGSFTYNPGTQQPFVNAGTGDFHLLSTSTVLHGVGANLGAPYNVDMDGNTAPGAGAWSIGAFNDPLTTTAVTFNEGTTVQTGVNPMAMVVNLDQTNTLVLKNGISLNPGVEKNIASVLVEVGNSNLGSSTYFVSFNDFSIVPTNEFATQSTPATFRVWRANVDICDGTINSNNQGDSNAPIFTANLSGSSLSSFTPASATINGVPNGTFNLEVHRGTGSGGAAHMVCTGATGSPLTGATCTPSVTAAGSYSVAPTINIWNGYTINGCSTGSWPSGATVGDFVNIRQDYGPSTQAMLTASGWGFSGAGSGVGETSDLPNDAALGDLPPGSANAQAMLVTGPMTISTSFDTGFPLQNMYQMVDPIVASVTHKRVSGSGSPTWIIHRTTQAGSGSGFSCSGTITPTTGTWVYASNFASGCTTGETDGSNTGPIGQVTLSMTVPSGTQMEFDNFYLSGASTGNTTAFRDEVVAALLAFGGGVSGAPTRVLNNQMPMMLSEQLQPDNRSVSNFTFGDNCNNGSPLWSAGCLKAPPITWAQHLALCEKLNASCWDVVGVNWSGTDAQTAADYLGGTCSVGYPTCTCGTAGATTRCQQNHSSPYTTTLSTREIHIEPGNENWNIGSSGGKWRTVPQCTAGANCSADYASGANTNAPYGFYVQNLASNFEGQASYNSAVEKIELGLQTSGSNTTFGADNLFKSTATAGTPFVTAAVNVAYAPYIDFAPTSAGFDNNAFSRQIQTDLANAYWVTNVTTSTMGIPVLAYPALTPTIYEMNGGMTSLVSTGIPTQTQVSGYQNSLGGGLADVLMMDEGCTHLGVCDFRAHFVLLQQQKEISNTGTTITATGVTANGSNVITGVTVTASMVPGANISGFGLSSSFPNPDANGTAQIWAVNSGAGTLTVNRNIQCSTTCGGGGNTYTFNNLVANLWGGMLGAGSQSNSNLRPFMQLAQNENTYAIKYGSTEFQSSYTSPKWNFPLSGTCPTACNGTPTTTNVPFLYVYGRKNGSFRSYTFYNTSDTTQAVTLSGTTLTGTVTQVVTGNGNAWQDTNESTALVAPVVTSVPMPSSLTLPAHSQVILSGTIGGSASNVSIGGSVKIAGSVTLQ